MTKRVEAARHRAASTGTFDLLSKAVTSNAGTMSRQAAVVAAAGGLVVTLGVSGSTAASKAEAAAPKAGANTTSLDIQRAANTEVHAAVAKNAPKTGSLVKVVAKPAPEPKAKLAQSTVTPDEPVQKTSESSSDSDSSSSKSLPKLQRTATQTSATSSDSSSDSSSSSSSSSDSSSKSDSSSSDSSDEGSDSSVSGSGLAATAKSGLGVPYVLGGNTKSGWDCSGFVRWVYAQNGMNIKDRTAAGMWKGGQFKATSNPKPGDIIVQRGGSHVAIYMGGGKYIGAQNPSSGTTYRDLGSTYDSFNGYYTWAG